jgi:hypothetical protein
VLPFPSGMRCFAAAVCFVTAFVSNQVTRTVLNAGTSDGHAIGKARSRQSVSGLRPVATSTFNESNIS